MKRHKLLIILLLLALGFAATCIFYVPDMIRGRISEYLSHTGFTDIAIEKIGISTEGIAAKNITIDAYKIDHIDGIYIHMDWTSLTPGKVIVDGLSISRIPGASPLPLKNIIFPALPDSEIDMRGMIIDLSTPYGALRLTGDAVVSAPDKNAGRTVQARLKADQYQLGFDTSWTGHAGTDGTFNLSANIQDFKSKLGPVQINRGFGWISASLPSPGALPVFSGEIEAGSGDIFSVPIQNILMSFATDVKTLKFTARTQASGIKGITLSVDTDLSDTAHLAQWVLDIADTRNFFDYLSALPNKQKSPAPPDALMDIGQLTIKLAYQADRRFANGPLPFSLTATSNTKNLLGGNILLYPDTFDVRGTAETSPDIAHALGAWLSLPNDKIGTTFLRLDGNVKKMLKNKSGIRAGIENNPGE